MGMVRSLLGMVTTQLKEGASVDKYGGVLVDNLPHKFQLSNLSSSQAWRLWR